MARMKTVFLYLFGIVGFFFLSLLLEDALIENMYYKMDGELAPASGIVIDNDAGKATNINGYMQFRLSNTSNQVSDDYVKIELYSKQGLLSGTKYVPITDLQPGHAKNYEVKLKGNELRSYKISIVNEVPDKTNIINILGWEVDLTNVLGVDITNLTIFGVKISDIFTWDNMKTAGANAWDLTVSILNSIPWWAYTIASGIVLWHMPSKFLFGFFPF